MSMFWLCLSIVVLYLFPDPFTSLNHRIYDLKLTWFANSELSSNVVHVDVDDTAISKVGQWPWDRAVSARVVERLAELGARLVVFDIMYTTRGKSDQGDKALIDMVAGSEMVVVPVGLIPVDLKSPRGLRSLDTTRANALFKRAWNLRAGPDFQFFHVNHVRNSGLPLLPIIESAKAVGNINASPDPDGIFRRVPLLIRFRDRFVPTLSLAALAAAWDADPKDVLVNSQDSQIEIRHRNGILRVPVDSRSNMLINWRPLRGSFKSYSILDLLSEQEDASRSERYKDKIAIIGVTWTGNTDIGINPLAASFPLSRVHSGALDTMLTGRFIREIPAFPFPIVGAVCALMLFLWIQVKTRSKHGIILLIGSCAAFPLGVVGAFAWGSLDIPSSQPLFIFVPAVGGYLVLHSISTELQLARQIKDTQDIAILALAKLAESRDEETGAHLLRIQGYSRVLCDRLSRREDYKDTLTPDFVDDLVRSSVLHDIGKVGIPDSILLSTAKFGPKEMDIMKQHTVIGGRALEEAAKELERRSFLTVGMEIAYHHHERWDGDGYPHGLKGAEIPLAARIVALADVYDALTTKRRYKKAFSYEEAAAIIVEGNRKHFDPDVVEAFQEAAQEFRNIRDCIVAA